jgi:hypothetical protein
MSTNYPKLKVSNHFLCSIDFCGRFCLQGRMIHLGSLSMKETSYMPSVKKKGSMCSTSFFRKSGMCVSNNRSCAYAPYIMKMIEKFSKKTFVKNVEHTKLRPNKQFTSIKPRARTRIPPPDAPRNYRGSGLGLLKMLRGIFTACKASKEVIIKRQQVILRNQHIIHHKLEIDKPLQEFEPTLVVQDQSKQLFEPVADHCCCDAPSPPVSRPRMLPPPPLGVSSSLKPCQAGAL